MAVGITGVVKAGAPSLSLYVVTDKQHTRLTLDKINRTVSDIGLGLWTAFLRHLVKDLRTTM